MINGLSSSLQATQEYQAQHQQQPTQTHKNTQGDQEPQDTVVLSKKATESSQTGDSKQGESH